MEEYNEDIKQENGLPSIGIPSEILFNPLFSNTEKVLYGFLRILSSQPSGCFATNYYLANLVGMTKNSLSRTINRLEKARYIIIERNDYRGYKKRVIRVNKMASSIYDPLINEVYPKFRAVENWIEDPKIIALAEKISDLRKNSSGNTSELIQEYELIHTGIQPSPSGNTIDNDIDDDSEKEINNLSKERCIGSSEPSNIVFANSESTAIQEPMLETQDVAKSKEVPVGNKQEVSPTRTPRRLRQPLVPIKKIEKPKRISIRVKRLIDYWNNLGIVKHQNPEAQVYQEASRMLWKLLNGKFFDKGGEFNEYFGKEFTEEEIILSMNRFQKMACDFNYLPLGSYKAKLKGTSLKNFLHNSYGGKEKSLFIDCLVKEPELAKFSGKLITDEDPEMTRELKKLYTKQILGRKVDNLEDLKFTTVDENKFRNSAKKLNDFFVLNKKSVNRAFTKLLGNDIFCKRQKAEYLFEALLNWVGEETKKIEIGHLCSDYTYNEIFSKWCNDQNIFNQGNSYS